MRRATVVVIVAFLLMAAAPAPKETAKEVAKKLQGTWIVEKQESKGKDASEPDTSTNIVIKGNTLTWTRTYAKKNQATFVEYTYNLDPAKDPSEMDFVQKLPDGSKGSDRLAIYFLDGDNLKICEGPPDGKRPKKFTSDKDSENYLMILKRKKD
jgi:uncharacterized protein (TIGR03067 family)